MENIEVKTADFAIAHAPTKILTHGIGSCVVVCYYDRRLKLGALGHFMLPKAPIGYVGGYRYVNYALDTIMADLESRGVNRTELVISLVGGAQMFKVLESSVMNIGKRNIDEARNWFKNHNLSPSLLAVGGNSGRNVEFDLETGFVNVNTNG